MSRVVALIPAAGLSRRMGRPKLALPLAGRTVLECVLATLRHAGVDDILVVVGPNRDELAALAESQAHVLRLAQDTPDMQATVMQGLNWLEERYHPDAEDDWLLLPADHPALEPRVIRDLVRCRAEAPDDSIIIPTFQGQRGHPVLVPWKHVGKLKNLPSGMGLNRFFRELPIKECLVDTPGILFDLDTPEDYLRLVESQSENRS